jgi:hypothetical protein
VDNISTNKSYDKKEHNRSDKTDGCGIHLLHSFDFALFGDVQTNKYHESTADDPHSGYPEWKFGDKKRGGTANNRGFSNMDKGIPEFLDRLLMKFHREGKIQR